jgi:cobalt-precorrin 5A hydrolase
MPMGTVIHLLAPFVESQESGPAVLVIDQTGRFVIPLLPGHLGEGNNIAKSLANDLGAQAVITTATDLSQLISFERVAAENNLRIIHPEALKRLNSRLMQGVSLEMHSDHEISPESPECDQSPIRVYSYDPEDYRQLLRGYQKCVKEDTAAVFVTTRILPTLEDGTYPPNILILSPRDIVVGVGCHSRVNEEYLYDTLLTTLKRQNLSESAVRILATISLKAEEPAILTIAKRLGVPITLVQMDDIRRVEFRFKQAPFEKHPTHAENASAPCAFLASQRGRMLLVNTTFPGGVTFAIAQEKNTIRL